MAKKKPKTTRLVLLVEGPTDVRFFERLIDDVFSEGGTCLTRGEIRIASCEGINRLEKKGISKVRREMKEGKISPPDVVVAVCYDTDQSGICYHPPFDEANVRRELKKIGIEESIFCAADATIEDWIMLDTDNVLAHLKLPASTKLNGSTGLEKLKKLYRKQRKAYTKQQKDTENLIDRLDMRKIRECLRKDPRTGIAALEEFIRTGKIKKKR